MKELTKLDIQQADDRPLVPLDVPEWDGRVYVRALSAVDRDQYWDSLFVGEGPAKTIEMRNARAKLAILCTCDAQGNRLFSDADAQWLGDKNSGAMERIYQLADRLSKVSPGAVEDLVKNSSATAGGDSSSASRSPVASLPVGPSSSADAT